MIKRRKCRDEDERKKEDVATDEHNLHLFFKSIPDHLSYTEPVIGCQEIVIEFLLFALLKERHMEH